MNLRINLHLFCTPHLLAGWIIKYLITQKVFILVRKARPSADGLGPCLARNKENSYRTKEKKQRKSPSRVALARYPHSPAPGPPAPCRPRSVLLVLPMPCCRLLSFRGTQVLLRQHRPSRAIAGGRPCVLPPKIHSYPLPQLPNLRDPRSALDKQVRP